MQLTAKRKERGVELNGLRRQQVAAAWAAAGLASVGVAAAQPADEGERVGTLSEVVVSATREEASIATIPGSVTVVTRETIEREARSGKNLGDILGERVPGLAPGSDTISNFGQTLRGRNVSVLIDGVPQNTTRNVSRNLATIDPAAIERIEVVRGATAIYGDSATGGVINIITRRASGKPAELEASAGASVSLTHPGDSLGVFLRPQLSGRHGDVDYLLNLAFERTNGFFDAHGERIPPDPHGQGGLADTDSWNVLAKLGYAIDRDQRIQLSIDRYDAIQDTEFASDPAVKAFAPRTVRSRAIPGLVLEDPQGTRNITANLDYRHGDLLGNRVHAQIFRRDYFTRFFPFDGRAFAIFGNSIFQSRLESEKSGGRLEVERKLEGRLPLSVLWGLDYTEEATSQPVSLFDPAAFDASGGLVFRKTGDRGWVPEIRQDNLGVFAQLELPVGSRWLLRGGVRYERVQVAVDDFVTLAGASVQGGELDFDEPLFNMGAVYTLTGALSAYVSFSQGFSVPDIGLTLRGAPNGASVNTLQLAPQKVDNYEIGVRGEWANTAASLAVYYNESELGAFSGGFNQPVVRAPERIYGLEATLDHRLSKRWKTGGTFTWLEGETDPDRDGRYTYLNSFRIPPPKLTAYLEHATTERWLNRLEVLYSGERDRFGGSTAFGERPVDGYVTVDFYSRYRWGRGTLQLAVENLLNEDYFVRESQLLRTGANDSYTASPGTILSVSYLARW